MKQLSGLLSVLLLSLLSAPIWAAQSLESSAPLTLGQAALPVSKIVLYTSGVGYFQRDGQVKGRAEAILSFPTDRINDLLKSLVVHDLDGGLVTTVAYGSRDPLQKILQSFAVDLTQNPSLGALLQQLRGEPLEIAVPAPLQGTILGVETKDERLDDRVITVEYLNLFTNSGLRTLPLPEIQQFKLLNAGLNADLQQALSVLATRHDTQKKPVRLRFDGAGQRRVRVGYVIEMPVWKMTYRLVLAEDTPPLLQGWAIVDNPTDEDWKDVELSLVSGRPVSFVMDLYTPRYVSRPVVTPEPYASLPPPRHDQALETLTKRRQKVQVESPGTLQEALPGQTMRASRARGALHAMAAAQAPPPLDFQQGVIAAAEAAELGDLFHYSLTTPISLRRHTSALLPIVVEEVQGTQLSIYNEHIHVKHPLTAVRLHNATRLHLMQGPLTVFDQGTYAGDAQLGELAPGHAQLISYAIDLHVEVEPAAKTDQTQLRTVKVRKGTLLVTNRAIREKLYTVKNRAPHPKTVLIEHPVSPDWKLVVPTQPAERSRTVYRFGLTLEPDKTAALQVREEKALQQTVVLGDAGPDLIEHYTQASEVSAEVQQALLQVMTLRRRLDETRANRRRYERLQGSIVQDQNRIRQNMARLAQNSSLYRRYVEKLDQQETELEIFHERLRQFQDQEQQQHQELQTFLLGLELD
ncbi:hypothetical protein NKDENANG_00281 [Candidatus Entotheonellaceae bacterium PAL068K]